MAAVKSKAGGEDFCLKGIPVSPGVVSGPLVVIRREEFHIPSRKITEDQIGEEVEKLESALVKTREQILEIKEHLSSSLSEKDASIFDAHLLVVEDAGLIEAVRTRIGEELLGAEYIYHDLMVSYAQSMRKFEDPYLRERAADLMDVGKRVLNNLLGRTVSSVYEFDEPSIILAHDLTPSDTAMLDRTKVLGFATELGSHTSHTAIMARSLNIPAVVGLKDACASDGLKDGLPVILDGHQGVLFVNPSDDVKWQYGEIEERRHQVEERLQVLKDTDAVTNDGKKVIISANVELVDDIPLLKSNGAEGVGLYRTEFMFLNRIDLPSEEFQYEMYRRFFSEVAPDPVIVRTLDIGGDKMMDHLGLTEELNPFLGWRAIRYCMERKDIFSTQLRAICRAAHGFHGRIMFPLISNLEEVVAAKTLLHEVMEELEKEGVDYNSELEIGVMIEVPSAALIIEHIVEEVDFVSIGTNDLIQYTLAVDRTNENVAHLYQPTHPAIIELISRVVEASHAGGIWVGVCGEVAGQISLTPLLVGLNVDELSMGSVFVPRVKKAIQTLNAAEMRELVKDWRKMASAETIADHVLEIAQKHYGELLE